LANISPLNVDIPTPKSSAVDSTPKQHASSDLFISEIFHVIFPFFGDTYFYLKSTHIFNVLFGID
jgi:hypothetical protein